LRLVKSSSKQTEKFLIPDKSLKKILIFSNTGLTLNLQN